MILKWIFNILVLLWLYHTFIRPWLASQFRERPHFPEDRNSGEEIRFQQKETPPPAASKKRDGEGEYIDYEEVK